MQKLQERLDRPVSTDPVGRGVGCQDPGEGQQGGGVDSGAAGVRTEVPESCPRAPAKPSVSPSALAALALGCRPQLGGVRSRGEYAPPASLSLSLSVHRRTAAQRKALLSESPAEKEVTVQLTKMPYTFLTNKPTDTALSGPSFGSSEKP